MKLIIDCSPEQLDIIGDHYIENKELGVLPDERAWMMAKAKAKYPTSKIKSAELDAVNGKWILELIVL